MSRKPISGSYSNTGTLYCRHTIGPPPIMQAKKLSPTRRGYSELSQFSSADADQHERIQILSSILGASALRYCLYCPPPSGYETRSIGVLRALHDVKLAGDIFDYAIGLALRDEVQRTGGIESGIWIATTDQE